MSDRVIGTILNAVGIIAGGVWGLIRKQPLPQSSQAFFKVALAVFTIFFGLKLVWMSLNGTWLQILSQLGLVVLALMLGKMTGGALHLQRMSNRLGQYARERIAAARPDSPRRVSEGYNVCALLFCAAPLAILGSVVDGLSGYAYPLGVKAAMDGLATMSFVAIFGWGAIMSALPVFVLQGTITLLCGLFLEPFLNSHGLVNPVNATCGLLIFCVGLIIFEIKKIAIADYLPSLVFAPLLVWWLLK